MSARRSLACGTSPGWHCSLGDRQQVSVCVALIIETGERTLNGTASLDVVAKRYLLLLGTIHRQNVQAAALTLKLQ